MNHFKTLKKWLGYLSISLLFAMFALCITAWYWLFNPLDRSAWRIGLHLPLVGEVHVRAYPLVRLATSNAGANILNGTRWKSNHGTLSIQQEKELVSVNCEQFNIAIPDLGKQPLALDSVKLTVHRNNKRLSGWIDARHAEQHIRLYYVAQIDMQGFNMGWSMPNTALSTLLTPFKTHSAVIQKAQVNGYLTASGTLRWPSREWSVKPILEGFEVGGLGTENLKSGTLKYRCYNPSQNNVQPYTWVSEKNMGRWLPKAVLIAEDAKFMTHPGYDMETLNLLLSSNYHGTRIGGSTISQQLAKNFFTGGEHNWVRKLEELLYAVEMERTLGKRRILALYLNTVDWGPGICGASQAARIYFSSSPSRLTPAQAAWLAGIIRNPHQAWKQEYQANKPNISRVEWVMSYLPKKVKKEPYFLQFSMSN